MSGHTINTYYALSGDESERIRIWKLWLCLMIPLNHSFVQAIRTGGKVVYPVIPPWLMHLESILCGFITTCVPPCFALISAVLLFRKPFDWGKNAAHKCRTLLVPLFLLTTIWIALYVAGSRLPFIGPLFAAKHSVASWTPRQWFTAYLGWQRDQWAPAILYPLWFLRDLMLMNLLAPVVKWCIDRFPRLYLGVLAALLVCNVRDSNFAHTVQMVFIFFSLGYYVVKYDLRFSDLDRIPLAWIAAAYALAILIAHLLRAHYAEWGAVRGIPTLLGVLFFARLSAWRPRGKWRERVLWLSQYGIAVYLFHERALIIMRKLMMRLLPPAQQTTLAMTLFLFYGLPAINIALCVLLALLLRKFLPRTYALLTGGR